MGTTKEEQMQAFGIRLMRIEDHPRLLALWERTPGICVRDADSCEATRRYLDRNPGLSFIAEAGGDIVGSLMSGHDGRRGYLQHLCVRPASRRHGIARALVQRCISALEEEHIHKSHIEVLIDNAGALAFWQALGWTLRKDIHRLSLVHGSCTNA